MSKHTPGPYLVEDTTVYALDESGSVNRFSASVQPGWAKQGKTHGTRTTVEERRATAALFAAAPDMIEACKLAFYSIMGVSTGNAVEQNGWCWPDDTPRYVHPVAEKLRAAIAKAEVAA